jgi:hypothetical protein
LLFLSRENVISHTTRAEGGTQEDEESSGGFRRQEAEDKERQIRNSDGQAQGGL